MNAPAPKPKERKHFQSIEGARGIASLLVFVSHLHLSMGHWLDRYLDLGKIGVVLFFLISGFLVLPSFVSRFQVINFAIRRFFRLYPVYWLSILLAIALMPDSLAWWEYGVNVTMMQQFIGVPNAISVYWTLTIEMAFYFFLVATALVDRQYLTNRLWVTFYALGLASVAIAALRYQTHYKLPVAMPLALHLMTYGALLRRNLEATADPLRRIRFFTLTACLAGFVTISCMLAYSFAVKYDENMGKYLLSYCVGILSFFLVVYKDQFLNRGLFVFLGKISYGFYVFHLPILLACRDSISNSLLAITLALTSTIAISFLAYKYIEVPANAWGRKLTT
ncbi:acyltransferase family protein [Neorhodopirellula lusitana]|uniref:acyltransferase family protein n=1 Tax=Neorhodopirellula lusitana TaxID=445327 RepID=UPI00384B8ACA